MWSGGGAALFKTMGGDDRVVAGADIGLHLGKQLSTKTE